MFEIVWFVWALRADGLGLVLFVERAAFKVSISRYGTFLNRLTETFCVSNFILVCKSAKDVEPNSISNCSFILLMSNI